MEVPPTGLGRCSGRGRSRLEPSPRESVTSVQWQKPGARLPAALGGLIRFVGSRSIDCVKGETDEQGYLAADAGAGGCSGGVGGCTGGDRLCGGEDQWAFGEGKVAAGEPA